MKAAKEEPSWKKQNKGTLMGLNLKHLTKPRPGRTPKKRSKKEFRELSMEDMSYQPTWKIKHYRWFKEGGRINSPSRKARKQG